MERGPILVLGAGELGGAVLRSLATHSSRSNTKIAVLLRSSSIQNYSANKRKEIDELGTLGVEIVNGDVLNDSVEQLAATFSNYQQIIGCSGMTFPPGTQVKIAEAALASVGMGKRRYFPWQFGVDYDVIGRNSSQDLFTEQLSVRDLLRGQSRMDWVIVSTGMFISFIFEPELDIVNAPRDRVTAIGSWENRVTVTSPEDIGKLTAEIAMTCANLNGVVFTASDTVSMRQIADIVDDTFQRKVVRRLKTVSQLKSELAGDPENGMRKYRVVFAEGIGVVWDDASTFNVQKGIETVKVAEWARQHLVD